MLQHDSFYKIAAEVFNNWWNWLFIKRSTKKRQKCLVLVTNQSFNGKRNLKIHQHFSWWESWKHLSSTSSNLCFLTVLPRALSFPLLMLGSCLDGHDALVHFAYLSSDQSLKLSQVCDADSYCITLHQHLLQWRQRIQGKSHLHYHQRPSTCSTTFLPFQR